jgi:hypothetical protein
LSYHQHTTHQYRVWRTPTRVKCQCCSSPSELARTNETKQCSARVDPYTPPDLSFCTRSRIPPNPYPCYPRCTYRARRNAVGLYFLTAESYSRLQTKAVIIVDISFVVTTASDPCLCYCSLSWCRRQRVIVAQPPS